MPKGQTIKEYVHLTGGFQSDVIAVDKGRQGQYVLWFRSEGNIKLVAFYLLHLCALRIDRSDKEAVCPCFKINQEKDLIKNIIYSKHCAPESIVSEIMPPTFPLVT